MPEKAPMPMFSYWMKFLGLGGLANWSTAPTTASRNGVRGNRKPVAFCLLFLVCLYLILELYLVQLVDSTEPGKYLPISSNSTHCPLSLYCEISVKDLLLGPVEFYIQKPLARFATKVLEIDSFVSANFVSVLHIFVAMISAKLISNDSLMIRRFGVLVYELRNFLDNLDGVVAKEEHKRTGDVQVLNQPTGPWGYFIDGICDGAGCIFLLFACLVYLQRRASIQRRNRKFFSLSNVVVDGEEAPFSLTNGNGKKDDSSDTSDYENGYTSKLPSDIRLRKCLGFFNVKRAGIPAFHFLVQLLLSSMLWNRDLLIYIRLLEPNTETIQLKEIKDTANGLLHSTFMWVIIFLWRFFNPLFYTELLLLFIFLDKMKEFLFFLQHVGYCIFIGIAGLAEIQRYTDPAIHPYVDQH